MFFLLNDVEELILVCVFCIVGCGYWIFCWLVDGFLGGFVVEDNVLGIDFFI